jgi:hypothetical protein
MTSRVSFAGGKNSNYCFKWERGISKHISVLPTLRDVFFSVVPSNGEHRVIRPIAERTPELSMSNPHDQKS